MSFGSTTRQKAGETILKHKCSCELPERWFMSRPSKKGSQYIFNKKETKKGFKPSFNYYNIFIIICSVTQNFLKPKYRLESTFRQISQVLENLENSYNFTYTYFSYILIRLIVEICHYQWVLMESSLLVDECLSKFSHIFD